MGNGASAPSKSTPTASRGDPWMGAIRAVSPSSAEAGNPKPIAGWPKARDSQYLRPGRIMSTNIFLQAALNGDSVHPASPRTPAAIAAAAHAAVGAGAHAVHLHAFDEAGRETLAGPACARVLHAIRARCPGTPVSLTTSAAIVGDPSERLRLVAAWTAMPDLVTANQGEAGIVELCDLLLSRGVAIEAGLLTSDDARAFARSGLADRCRRVLVEPLDADPGVALRHAAEMEEIVAAAGIPLEQVHHGYGAACWAVNRRALERGHGIRTGLEDVTLLPDGRPAVDNADLVVAAVRLIREVGPGRDPATSTVV